MVCSLSAGGLGLEARLRIEQGDAIRLRILPHRRGRAVTVGAIVWNDRPVRGGGRKGALRMLGCVVSDPPQSYLDLIAEVEESNGCEEPLPPPVRGVPDVDLPRSSKPLQPRLRGVPDVDLPRSSKPLQPRLRGVPDVDLPRSREPLPPPKPPPEELLPSFRVRVKQVGGHRTRTFRVRARSLSEAGDRVRAALCGAEGSWDVLDAVKESDSA